MGIKAEKYEIIALILEFFANFCDVINYIIYYVTQSAMSLINKF